MPKKKQILNPRNYKDRKISALKGVITKQRKKIAELKRNRWRVSGPPMF